MTVMHENKLLHLLTMMTLQINENGVVWLTSSNMFEAT